MGTDASKKESMFGKAPQTYRSPLKSNVSRSVDEGNVVINEAWI